MSKDFFLDMKLTDGQEVIVLYHYEDAIPIVDHAWSEDMETDVVLSEAECIRISNIIEATYKARDLSR